jgi:hypothetical protein
VFRLFLLVAACGSEPPPRGEPAALRITATEVERSDAGADVLALALEAAGRAWSEGWGTTNPKLALIDFSRPSTEPRLWVLDLRTGRSGLRERVSQGRGRGFSNEPGSHASSLGLFVTGEAYEGSNGPSLRLHGLEPGVNDRAFERAIVIHGASYAGEAFVRRHGRLGTSRGCPAVRPAIAAQLVSELEGGALVFAYYPDGDWLGASRFLARR